MQRKFVVVLAALAMSAGWLVVNGADKPAADPKAAPAAETGGSLKTNKEKISYGIGMSIGQNIKQDGIDVDVTLLAKGIADVLSGAKPAIAMDEFRAAMEELQKDMQKKEETRNVAAGDKNKTAGEAFLAANKSKEGVKTTASGLQYTVVKEGAGKIPTAADKVKVHYTGTLIDGTKFDSSVDRGEPITFPVNGVIKGWTEALQLMKAGAKYKLFIPSDLAYGPRGAGALIGPNSVLVFDVELLEVVADK